MYSFLCITVIVSGLAVTSADVDCDNDPCKEQGKQQILCLYPDPNPTPSCGMVYTVGMDQWEKDNIVNLHNELRQRVASGRETRGPEGPQPPATDMNMIRWDDELAKGVQRWANQCRGHDLPHECFVSNGKALNAKPVGMWASIGSELTWNYTNTFTTMYNNALPYMTKDNVEHFKPINSSSTENNIWYGIMMYSKTEMIGCGKLVHRSPADWENYYGVLCSYAPGGPIPGTRIYNTNESGKSQSTTEGAFL